MLLFGKGGVSHDLWKVGSDGHRAKTSFSKNLHQGVPVVGGHRSDADRLIHQGADGAAVAIGMWVPMDCGVARLDCIYKCVFEAATAPLADDIV